MNKSDAQRAKAPPNLTLFKNSKNSPPKIAVIRESYVLLSFTGH